MQINNISNNYVQPIDITEKTNKIQQPEQQKKENEANETIKKEDKDIGSKIDITA